MQLPEYITDDNEMAVWPGVPEPDRIERAITLLRQMDDSPGTRKQGNASASDEAGPTALRDAEYLRQRVRNENLRMTLQSDSWGSMTPAALFDLALGELSAKSSNGFNPRKELVIATLDRTGEDFTMTVTTVPENKSWMGFDPAYRRLNGGTALIMLRQRSKKRAQGMIILPNYGCNNQETPSGGDSAATMASLVKWHGGAVQVVPHTATS